jgi:hypothetical protein
MARLTKIAVVALATAVVVATMVPLAVAGSETVAAAAAQHRAKIAEFKPVGDSGLRGLGLARKSGGQIHFHATLACSESCPTGGTANDFRSRFRFAEGRCGKPTGKTFTLNAGKLGPGGLDVNRTVAITADNRFSPVSVAYEWDFDYNSGPAFRAVACANAATLKDSGKPSAVAAVGGFKSIGGSGLVLPGLGFVHKDGDKLRFHAALACSQTCPTGNTANGVPIRFALTEGGCNKPAGKSFSLKAGKLGPGGLDFHSASSFDPSNDPLTRSKAMRAAWDPDNNGSFEPAACGDGYIKFDKIDPDV